MNAWELEPNLKVQRKSLIGYESQDYKKSTNESFVEKPKKFDKRESEADLMFERSYLWKRSSKPENTLTLFFETAMRNRNLVCGGTRSSEAGRH